MTRFFSRLFLISALLLPSVAGAATYWVSPTGSAAASGADSTTNAGTLTWICANYNATNGIRDTVRFKSGDYGTEDVYTTKEATSSSDAIVFLGFPQDPSAVRVDVIRSGGPRASSTNLSRRGSYCEMRWITAEGGIEGVTYYLSGDWTAPTDVTIRRCVSTADKILAIDGKRITLDSLTIRNADGGHLIADTEHHSAGGVPEPSDNTLTNSTLTSYRSTGLGGAGSFIFCQMKYNQRVIFQGNTFNTTFSYTSSGNGFLNLLYGGSEVLFKDNIYNVAVTGLPDGSKGLWAHRDFSHSIRYVGNRMTVTGTAGMGIGWAQAGSSPGTTNGNYMGGNVIRMPGDGVSTSESALFLTQNGARGDTIEFNLFDNQTGHAMDVSANGFTDCIVRHNTFIGSTFPTVDFSAATSMSGTRLSANLIYSRTANGSSPLLSLPSAANIADSVGTLFAPLGTASNAIRYNGVNGTPGSGGNYGVSGKAVWGSPAFKTGTAADSAYGTGAGIARATSYAYLNRAPSLQDGFSGAYSDSVGGATGTVGVVAPDSVVYLRITDATPTAVSLRWNSPADDGSTGAAVSYDMRRSTSAITSANWASATTVTGEPSPSPAGTVENMTVTGLAASTTYHFAMKSTDDVGNISGLSEVPDTTTDANTTLTITAHRIQAKDDVAGYTFTIVNDDDSSATVLAFCGTTSPASDSAHTPIRRFATSGTYATSFFGLTPETRYYVRISVVDGASSLTFDTTFVTRPLRWWAGSQTGPSVYVAPNGSDSNSGLTSLLPKRTLANAYAVLVGLENGGRGGALRLAAGTYYGRHSLDGGSGHADTGYIILPQNENETVVLDGADERIVNGSTTLTWAAVNAAGDPETGALGDTLFRAAYAATDSLDGLWVGGYAYFRFTTDAEIWNKGGTSGAGAFTFLNTLAPGCYYYDDAADSIYVRAKAGVNIRTATLYPGYRGNLLGLDDPYLIVRGLTFRHAGGLPDGNGIGVRIGQNGPASNSIVHGCTFDELDRAGVHGQEVAGRADSLVVAQCTYDGAGTERFGYTAAKGRREEQRTLMSARGFFNTVIENTVRESFNGISQNGSASNITEMSETDISRNTVTDVSDDAIEAESGHGVNLRVIGNTLARFGNGISIAPMWTGPAWYVQNFGRYATTGGGMWKIGDGAAEASRGDALIYHNTFVADTTVNNYGHGAPGGAYMRKKFRNNVLTGTGTSWPAIRNTLGSTAADTVGAVTNSFNYDLLYTAGTTRVATWKNTNYDTTTITTLIAWEANGVKGLNPAWQDSSRSRWAAMRGVDRAQKIAGITGALITVRGAAGDIGAFEASPAQSVLGNRLRWYNLTSWFRRLREWLFP